MGRECYYRLDYWKRRRKRVRGMRNGSLGLRYPTIFGDNRGLPPKKEVGSSNSPTARDGTNECEALSIPLL